MMGTYGKLDAFLETVTAIALRLMYRDIPSFDEIGLPGAIRSLRACTRD